MSGQSSVETVNNTWPCLGEISFDITLDATLFAHGSLSVDTLSLAMNNAKTVIHGSFYDFLREAKKQTRPPDAFVKVQKTTRRTTTRTYPNDSYHKITPIIPKNFNFIIKAATFSAAKENFKNDFSAKINYFSVSWSVCLLFVFH